MFTFTYVFIYIYLNTYLQNIYSKYASQNIYTFKKIIKKT